MNNIYLFALSTPIVIALVVFGIIITGFLGVIAYYIKCLRKVPQGTALIKTGQGGTEVSFDKMTVVPVLHIVEMMDISVKRIEIDRSGVDGLILSLIHI